jgi:TRAP-type transport system periplasmic protein
MQARGLKVQQLNAEQLRHWDDFAAQIYPLIRGRMIPAPAFDETMRLVGQYRAAHPNP